MKKMGLSCPAPAECVIPTTYALVEPRHLRQDMSRPGDVYASGQGIHMTEAVMDIVITSELHKSCLFQTTLSSDFVIRDVENRKFISDANSSGLIQNSATGRFISLTLNHLGLRGGHL